jgi:hypothetical protein
MKKLAVILMLGVLLVGLLAAPVSAGWMDNPTKPTVADWTNMALNITSMRVNGTVILQNGTSRPWYNLTTSYVQIPGSQQALNFTTSGAGSYFVGADLRENRTLINVATSGTYSEYALCDANGTAVVTNSERMGTRLSQISNITTLNLHFTWIYTNATGQSEVGVCGKISSDTITGQWSVDSDASGRSVLTYFRLP